MATSDLSGNSELNVEATTIYRPVLRGFNQISRSEKSVFGVVPARTLQSKMAFIKQSRDGIPGAWVKDLVSQTGLRSVFVSILGVRSENLSRVYRRKALGKDASEEVLDTVRVLEQAVAVWESKDAALEWMSTPIPALDGQRPKDIFDTFEGRRWVAQTLNKIEHGEFS